MGRIMFDVHDAASRFFHLEHAMEAGLEALSLANVDVGNLDEFPEEMHEDIVESRLIMAGVQQRLFMQSMTATVFGTFEYCMISSLRNYQLTCKAGKPISHGLGVNLSTAKVVLTKLGFDYDAAQNDTQLKLAKDIRDKVMHRGGLVLSTERQDFLALANRSDFVGLLPFADDNEQEQIESELEQIDIGAPFLRSLIADCVKLLDAVHEHLSELLRSKARAAGVAH